MNNDFDFFPTTDYTIPTSSNYMKFQKGKNTFRVLSSAIVGYEYWNTQNKPVRSREAFDKLPEDIQIDKDGNPKKIQHFWAFVVWNYQDKKVQILQLTQKSIMTAIQGLVHDTDWGNPKNYDITVNKTGDGFDTEYSVTPRPHSAFEAVKDIPKIDLEALFKGEDPFASK